MEQQEVQMSFALVPANAPLAFLCPLVHVTLAGLPAAAEILIGQFRIIAAFLDIYLSWCILHHKYLPSELSRLLPALLLDL